MVENAIWKNLSLFLKHLLSLVEIAITPVFLRPKFSLHRAPALLECDLSGSFIFHTSEKVCWAHVYTHYIHIFRDIEPSFNVRYAIYVYSCIGSILLYINTNVSSANCLNRDVICQSLSLVFSPRTTNIRVNVNFVKKETRIEGHKIWDLCMHRNMPVPSCSAVSQIDWNNNTQHFENVLFTLKRRLLKRFYLQPMRVCSVESRAESVHEYDFAFMWKAIQALNVTSSDDEPAQQMTLPYA